MAQNVTIAGASYPDVPSITVPKTGGGTASFVDTTDADAQASEILNGKTAYVNGVRLLGTGGAGVPSGGTAGQVLAKKTNTDYDTEWVNQSEGVDPATATPLMDGTGAVGTSTKYAREDHVHPSDTSKQDTLGAGDISTNMLASQAVTRAKLADDALYSPIKLITDNYSIQTSDLGKTLSIASSAYNKTITLPLAVAQALPTGAEIAVIFFGVHQNPNIIIDLSAVGGRGVVDGVSKSLSKVKIKLGYDMVVLKKMGDNNNQLWAVFGNVEEVTT